MSEKTTKMPSCIMCGRTFDEGTPMIEGYNGYICPECAEQIAKVHEYINMAYSGNEAKDPELNLHTPKEIKEYLDQYIIGQDHTKMVISTAVYNHYKRIKYNTKTELQKSCILLMGPTGTGKTEIARAIAKYLDVPFAIADATSLTQAGYVGDDVETILTKLLQASNYDVAKAERGIVFIDEIDKIANAHAGNPSITRDVSGEGVQQALLKLIEGNDVLVPPNGGRKHPDQQMVKVNTENILFICSGAFVGMEKIIGARMNKKSIGYTLSKPEENEKVDEKKYLHHVTPQDVKRFGLIPELIGRLPIITYTDELDKDALIKILTEPKNAIVKQYTEMFEIDGIELKFKKEVYDYIADLASKTKTGARGLRNIMERILLKPMFELPGTDKKTFTVTKKIAEQNLKVA